MFEDINEELIDEGATNIMEALGDICENNKETVVCCIHAIAQYCLDAGLPFEQFYHFVKEAMKEYRNEWPLG